jgi:hypothetical protein
MADKLRLEPKRKELTSFPIKSIKIAGIKYDVNLVTKLGEKEEKKDSGEVGCTHPDYTHINISTENSVDHSRCVMVHECVEAINHRYDAKLSHHQVYLIETAIIQLLRDNPDLVKFICG